MHECSAFGMTFVQSQCFENYKTTFFTYGTVRSRVTLATCKSLGSYYVTNTPHGEISDFMALPKLIQWPTSLHP